MTKLLEKPFLNRQSGGVLHFGRARDIKHLYNLISVYLEIEFESMSYKKGGGLQEKR